MKPCLTQDCIQLVEKGHCPAHQQAVDRARNNADERKPYQAKAYRQLRRYLLKDGRSRCAWCGTRKDLTLDHEVPLSKGGTNDPSNLGTVLCRSCNAKKGGRENAMEGPWQNR